MCHILHLEVCSVYQMSLPNEGVWMGKIEIKFLKLMYHPYPFKLKFAATNTIKCFLPLDLKVLNFFTPY